MGFSKVIDKIIGLLEKALEKIKGIIPALSAIIGRIKLPRIKIPGPDISQFTGMVRTKFDGLSAFVDRFLDHVPEEKKRPMLIGLGGLLGLFLVLLIAALALNSGKKQSRVRESSSAIMAAGLNIPQEELFIPGEPDFIPEFLLVREPRRYWSLEDIRPFWKAPQYDMRWRDEITSAVDQLMEGVP